ncbi:MAG TPA: glucose-6-phosphate dehydrogenase assembly protein OpcA [Planctomycetota bacterium]|nr:glucose-6-phosphate dehydrogenase assembly protein OpcA [Planctomycetota bacterium]
MSNLPMMRTAFRSTSPRQIRDALQSLWKMCLPDMQGGDVARSLTINFIGVAREEDDYLVHDAVGRLQRRTPCRAFLLLIDDDASEITAEVTATTRVHGPKRDIVLEEIVIRMPESEFDQIPGLVRPLLMNDLPNHLFWSSDWPRVEQHFDDLSQLCDHAVVDSRCFEAPARVLERLDSRRQAGQRLTDLSWLRLRPWRRALAEAFERVPWQPGAATTGEIRHGAASAATAMLLANWLRTRLGAEIELDPAGDAAGTGPDRVALQTSGCEVELVAGSRQITSHVTTPGHCYVPFKVPTLRASDSDLLAAAIDLG